MKIALVVYQYSDSKGGVERYVSDLSRGLLNLGHEVHIFCHRHENTEHRTQNTEDRNPQFAIRNPKSEIIFHPVSVNWDFYAPLRHISFANESARMLKESRQGGIDIIQGFGRTYYQDVLRFGSGCHWEYLKQTHPAVNTFFGRCLVRLNPRHALSLRLEKKSFAPGSYKKVICISNLVKREVRDYYAVPEEAITVIHNAVDVQRFTPQNRNNYREKIRAESGFKPEEIVILFVGSGFERKGLRYAIEGLALVDKNIPIKLLVIGKGKVRKYRDLAESKGLGDRILFLGTTKGIERYYSAADIFLFPTLYDAFGTVVLEAMASGLPVIVSNQSGAAEVVAHAQDGFVINPRDSAEIARRITYLADPVWRENMGKAARATALLYSFDEHLKKVMKVYEEVIGRKALNSNI